MRNRLTIGTSWFVRLALVAASLIAFMALGLLSGATTPVRAASSCDVATSRLALDGEEQAALDAISAYRVSMGRPALQYSPLLTRIALWKSTDMATHAYAAHDDLPLGRSVDQRFADCGYVTGAVSVAWAENIAGCDPSAAVTVAQWKQSAEHIANILDGSLQYAGVKRVQGPGPNGAGGTCWYWTMSFGSLPDSATGG